MKANDKFGALGGTVTEAVVIKADISLAE